MRNLLTTLAETLGMCLIVVGIGLYSAPAALIVAGVCLVLIGVGAA